MCSPSSGGGRPMPPPSWARRNPESARRNSPYGASTCCITSRFSSCGWCTTSAKSRELLAVQCGQYGPPLDGDEMRIPWRDQVNHNAVQLLNMAPISVEIIYEPLLS